MRSQVSKRAEANRARRFIARVAEAVARWAVPSPAAVQPKPPAFEVDQVVEACARICESRARSFMQKENYDDHRARITQGNEAMKCAGAVRLLGRREFEAPAVVAEQLEERPRYQIWWRRLCEPGQYLNCSELTERDLMRRLIGAVATSGPVIVDRIERETPVRASRGEGA